MAVTAQTGIFSFGGQAAKGTISSTFYQHRAADVDLSPISDDRLGPPEVGGLPVPTIPYRAGVVATGGAAINPRLEDTIGWLLYGALGAHTTEADKDVLGSAVTGMVAHEFTFATDQAYIPYMSFRKEVPGHAGDGSEDLGESFVDCKIVNLTLALPNDGLITARVDVLGRTFDFTDDPSWSYENTQMEDYESIPIGCVTGGYLKVPGYSATELPITMATVTLTNAPLDIRQEKVYGDPFIEDVTVIGRALTVDMVVKWKDPELYRDILTGSTTGTEWTPAPWVEDLDVYALTPQDMPGSAPLTPWGLRVQASKVMYQVAGGIRLAGNQSVMMRVTGTAIAPSGTDHYCDFLVGNASTQYTWPT